MYVKLLRRLHVQTEPAGAITELTRDIPESETQNKIRQTMFFFLILLLWMSYEYKFTSDEYKFTSDHQVEFIGF